MGNTPKKVLVGLLSIFLVCLIVSTATTTVTAADSWGTLKAGDEMQWQSDYEGTVKIKILSVDGVAMSIELTKGGSKETITVNADVDDSNRNKIRPWLSPLVTLTGQTQSYEWEGTTYQADYIKSTSGSGRVSEFWKDKNTGILFEWRATSTDGEVTVKEILTSTTADLAESGSGGGGGCLGTILIALFSVTTMVSYGLIRFRKK